MAILSGEYGLLDPTEPIPWYDRALTARDVPAMTPRVAGQLRRYRPRRLILYARPPSTPGWRPYHDLLAAACAATAVECRVVDARGELVGADAALTGRLFDLVEEDERTRARLAANGRLFEGYAPEMEAVHRANAAALAGILDRQGWPGRSLAGSEAAIAAWAIAQHAISLPDFQRRCRDALARAVAAGEAEAEHHARLVDRIRFNERRPQVYGTIFDWDEAGVLSPWPIEGESGVDERRRRCGLPDLAAAVAEARQGAAAEGERPPASFAERQRRIDAWAREVGWLPEPRPGGP